jgi:hypothetical protein
MTINILLVLIALVCLRISKGRRTPFVVFILPGILFQVLAHVGAVPDSVFFLFGSMLDAVVISLLVRLKSTGLTTIFIGWVSLMSIVGNVFGWLAYDAGLEPVTYDGLFIGLYSLVLGASLMEWYCDAGADSYGTNVRGGTHQRG